MNITLQATNIDLNDDLRDFVHRKMGDCMRAFGDMSLEPVQIAIELEKSTHRHPQEREDEQRYRAEANVSVPGHLIRAEESAMDLEQAVVKLKHTLTREIRQWRERLIADRRKGARKAKQNAIGPDTKGLQPESVEIWEEEWAAEEEKRKEQALMEEDLRWEEWEEGGEDQRDYV